MPEGHLIHRIAADNTALLGGAPAGVSSPQGRFADGAAAVDGRVLQRVDAYGKHLLYRFDGDASVHVHLGMAGRVLLGRASERPRVAQARLRLEGRGSVVHVIAPARCELVDPGGVASLLGRLGPDPLRDDDPSPALARIASSSAPIGAVLLDQSVIAGIGNVLRAEILFLLGIHPSRPARSLDEEQRRRLWDETVRVMRDARDRGRIVTRPPAGTSGDDHEVAEVEGRYVYKRETCGRCGTPVSKSALAGRTAYACPTCQAA